MDPNGNTVLLNRNVSLSHGVAGGELSLHKDAVAGMWKIAFASSVRFSYFTAPQTLEVISALRPCGLKFAGVHLTLTFNHL